MTFSDLSRFIKKNQVESAVAGLMLLVFLIVILGQTCTRMAEPEEVTIVEVMDNEPSAWSCDTKYNTLVERKDGTRIVLCGKYGKVGDKFKR